MRASGRPVLTGTEWKFLADENPRPAAASSALTSSMKNRVKQLEEELQRQREALALDEFVQGLGDQMTVQAGISSPSPNEMCDQSTSATSDFIPSDRPEVTPVVTGRIKPRSVPSRRSPPSIVLNGGAEVAASPRKEGPKELQADHKVPPRSAEHESNSPPVVIWRHSAPIKIATNVPPELLPPGQVDLYESIVTSGSPTGEASGSDSGSAAGTPKKLVKPRGTEYGAAWYLPVGQWEASAKGVDLGAKEDLVEEGRTGGPKTTSGNTVNGEVVTLYSSKRYVEYLREKKVARVPHYLAGLKHNEGR